MKMIKFLVLSAVGMSLPGLEGLSQAFSGKAFWDKQFAPARLSSIAGMLSKEGPWLILKYSSRLWGDKPVNPANKFIYPKSLRVRGGKKKKLK